MNAGAKISLVFLGFMALLAVLAPIAAPHDPYATFGKNLEPGTHEVWVGAAKERLTFLFGTDGSGRDILSRMLYGARYSLVIGLAATAFALLCGAVIGSVAAVSRKWISEVIMRIMDIVMSFPGIALAAVLVLAMVKRLPVVPVIIIAIYHHPECDISKQPNGTHQPKGNHTNANIVITHMTHLVRHHRL